jgi:hypothetical protein
MSLVVLSGHVQVWMIYLFVLAVGIGQVVDMTNRPALVHDLVGDRLLGNAMALEPLSMAAGNMLGALSGGAVGSGRSRPRGHRPAPSFLTGVLASGTGMGMLIGSALMVALDPPRRGRIYVLGSFAGMACLIVFTLMRLYPLALVMLVVTGIASAGFASVQSALVLQVALTCGEGPWGSCRWLSAGCRSACSDSASWPRGSQRPPPWWWGRRSASLPCCSWLIRYPEASEIP